MKSLILSHHSRFNATCECNEEELNDADNKSRDAGRVSGVFACGVGLNLRTTASQKCAAVPRRARVKGS